MISNMQTGAKKQTSAPELVKNFISNSKAVEHENKTLIRRWFAPVHTMLSLTGKRRPRDIFKNESGQEQYA